MVEQAQYEKAVRCSSKYIVLQPNQAQLYGSQGEAYLCLGDFQSAAGCYQQASRLEPPGGSFYHTRLALIYHLQGQCLFDGGQYLDALESFSKSAEWNPQRRPLRSVACLSALGRYTECLRLVSGWLADRPSSDLYVLRARLYWQLDQPAACYHDNHAALLLEPLSAPATTLLSQLEAGSDLARQKAVEHILGGRLTIALAKITSALDLHPREPRHYLLRGILYRRMKDFTASIEDLVRAVELGQESEEESAGGAGSEEEEGVSVVEEALGQLVLTYNDFGVHCSSRGLQAEATLLLDRAIQEETGDSRLYLNRAACLVLQGHWSSALSDYQQAQALNPGDQNTRIRLASLHHILGVHHHQHRRYQEALQSFSQAVLLDPSRATFYENRSRTSQVLQDPDLNQLSLDDALRTLVLDPENQQVLPLVRARYPGCSVVEVMSGPDGVAVRSQLLQMIQSHPCASEQQGLQPCETEEEQKPLAGQSDLQELVTRHVQMKQKVQSFLHHRPPLHQPWSTLSPL
ncbi:tetratricopeptide repeat protein 16 [Gadus macrocephalus]|uniref:tetratricopeptide repeat protein 16 n=1 Tax=Gadus macrocephalus TaxID=80720 RepID=UPI0028CB706F|nr:tetratricopeptide repeat protein 16 [Gadus macrocephalus]